MATAKQSYTIGLDFGTLSLRGVLMERTTGQIVKAITAQYPHGTIDSQLQGADLPSDFALQNAEDYLICLDQVVAQLSRAVPAAEQSIKAIGIDFTACTVVALAADGRPLSSHDEFCANPHAHVKLWKHHGAVTQARQLTELAAERQETWLKRYGGTLSSEWLLPKVMETLQSAPDVFEATDLFVEAGDFVCQYLTNQLSRSACHAGYKGCWSEQSGFVSREYLMAVDPRLADIYQTKLRGETIAIGQPVGLLSTELAARWQLSEQTVVASSVIDAHATVPAVGMKQSAELLMIIGTSSCDVLLHDDYREIVGINGVVSGGVLPDLVAYESGQAAVGDAISWLIEQALPAEYYQRAEASGQDIYSYMMELLLSIPLEKKPLLALDWWNGSRSVIMDTSLSGVMIGLKLTTTAEEVLRAIIESTAFGKRKVVETYLGAGLTIDKYYAAGGLAEKNSYLMQVYADVLQREIHVVNVKDASAKGAALYGELAYQSHRISLQGADDRPADKQTMAMLIDKLCREDSVVYRPNSAMFAYYDALYQLYQKLSDYFGNQSDIIHRLNQIKLT